MEVFVNIVYLSVGFFVPLLPAYILYKFLPSKTSVRGPFKGLDINLKGAFGGYFLLVLIAFSLIYVMLTPSKPITEPITDEVWRVTGRVETGDPTDTPTNHEVRTTIEETPPDKVGTEGGFVKTIIVGPGHVESQRDFPDLEFYRSGYANYVLVLNLVEESSVNKEMKTITIDEIITLKPFSSEEYEESEWSR